MESRTTENENAKRRKKSEMSIELKLKAENGTEERVLKYLQDNASEALAEKINSGTKTLSGALEFAKGEAKKLAGQETCVCVEDATVFGWIIHFFEEDGITAAPAKKAKKMIGPAKLVKAADVKKEATKKAAAKAVAPVDKDDGPQMTMFETLFTGV